MKKQILIYCLISTSNICFPKGETLMLMQAQARVSREQAQVDKLKVSLAQYQRFFEYLSSDTRIINNNTITYAEDLIDKLDYLQHAIKRYSIRHMQTYNEINDLREEVINFRINKMALLVKIRSILFEELDKQKEEAIQATKHGNFSLIVIIERLKRVLLKTKEYQSFARNNPLIEHSDDVFKKAKELHDTIEQTVYTYYSIIPSTHK